MNLAWTTEPPTEPGWYWVKWRQTSNHPAEVAWTMLLHPSHFAGPIPEPQEEPTV